MKFATKLKLWALIGGVSFGIWQHSVAAGVFMLVVGMWCGGFSYVAFGQVGKGDDNG